MCARCHDHPFEKWVQKDYYGMAAFFSQVYRKSGRRQDIVVYRTESAAKARHPRTGELLDPRYLAGGLEAVGAEKDARVRLAYGQNSFIGKMLTFYREYVPGRVDVILVKEKLGF